jgi:hypothetical protein
MLSILGLVVVGACAVAVNEAINDSFATATAVARDEARPD